MKVIGITGGVGSGKTYIINEFTEKQQKQGHKVYTILTDQVAHEIMRKGKDGYDEIIECFGEKILDNESGEINKNKLSKIVFNNPQKLSILNNIIHPKVHEYIGSFIEKNRDEVGTIFLESAIFYESGCDKYCDEVWYVYAPESERKKRLMLNRGYSEEKTVSIMNTQMTEDEYRERADKVILNSVGEIPHL